MIRMKEGDGFFPHGSGFQGTKCPDMFFWRGAELSMQVRVFERNPNQTGIDPHQITSEGSSALSDDSGQQREELLRQNPCPGKLDC